MYRNYPFLFLFSLVLPSSFSNNFQPLAHLEYLAVFNHIHTYMWFYLIYSIFIQQCCLCCSSSQVLRTAWFLVIHIITHLTRSSTVSWAHALTHLLDPARITQVRAIQVHFTETQRLNPMSNSGKEKLCSQEETWIICIIVIKNKHNYRGMVGQRNIVNARKLYFSFFYSCSYMIAWWS